MHCTHMLLIYLLFVGYDNQQISDISVTYEHSTSVGKYKNILTSAMFIKLLYGLAPISCENIHFVSYWESGIVYNNFIVLVEKSTGNQ